MQQTLPPTTERWTVLSLIETSSAFLAKRGFDEARLHVELLLADVLCCSRLQLYTNFDRPLTPQELSDYKALLGRRLTHEPLQYILGETEFMGLPFFVDASVLIPRPETEILVEKALEAIKSFNKEKVEVLDIGTGSGNIPIAIAKFAPNAVVTSIDISNEALAVARHNAERNQVTNVSFANENVFKEFLRGRIFDLIVSNPPYISLNEFAELQPEVRDFEPRIATTDEADGFTFIRRLTEIAKERLRPNGLLFVEIAYNQSDQTQTIARAARLNQVEVIPDYAGHPRILVARR